MPTSIPESIKVELLSRLQTPTPVVSKVASIRRSHLVGVSREMAPSVYVIDGIDDPDTGKASQCPRRKLSMLVTLIVRSDDAAATDAYMLEILSRLDPSKGSGYGTGVTLVLGRIASDQEIADKDVQKLDIDLSFQYSASGEWSIELPA